ncbi:MAG: VOC family protein [Mycetocola sp.]
MVKRGIPGLAGPEHIGFTVPDLEQATDFFVNVIGCELVYSVGPFEPNGEWMSTHLNIANNSVMRELRFFRCGNGTNFEVFQFEAEDQNPVQPRNSDIGGHHVAFYVDDLDVAVEYLQSVPGVEVLGKPTSSGGPSAGQRWIYFLSPWGMQFELVSFPGGKHYEATATTLLWHPKD